MIEGDWNAKINDGELLLKTVAEYKLCRPNGITIRIDVKEIVAHKRSTLDSIHQFIAIPDHRDIDVSSNKNTFIACDDSPEKALEKCLSGLANIVITKNGHQGGSFVYARSGPTF